VKREVAEALARLEGVHAAGTKRKALPEGWWHLECWDIRVGKAPVPRQREVISDTTSDVLLYGGSVGGGKTETGIWNWTKWAVEYPGIVLAMGRADFTDTKNVLLPRARAYWEELNRRYGLRIEVVEDSKSSVWRAFFRSAASKDAALGQCSEIVLLGWDRIGKYQGVNFHGGWVDEAGLVKEAKLKEVENRVRGSGMEGTEGYPQRVFYTSNWTGGYLDKHIAAPAMRGEISTVYPGARFVPSSTLDLEEVYDASAEKRGQTAYHKRLVLSGHHTAEQIRDGWVPPNGTVWPVPIRVGRGRNVIVLDEFLALWGGPYAPAAGEWAYFGMDHGIGHPSAICSLLVRTRPGSTGPDGMGEKVVVVGALGEFYQPLDDGKVVRNHRVLGEAVLSMMGGSWENHVCWGDPRMKHGARQQGVSNFAEHPSVVLRKMGLRWQPALMTGPNDRGPRMHFVREAIAFGRVVYVEEGTIALRTEIENLMRLGKDAGGGEDPSLWAEKGSVDHAANAFEYGLCGIASKKLVDFGKEMPKKFLEMEFEGEGPRKLMSGIVDRYGRPVTERREEGRATLFGGKAAAGVQDMPVWMKGMEDDERGAAAGLWKREGLARRIR